LEKVSIEMLIHKSRPTIINMVELWVYKTGKAASEFVRIVDCDEGYKVGVLDYTDPSNELVTKEDNCTEDHAKRIRQRILEAVKNDF
jgi:hypothetical protein